MAQNAQPLKPVLAYPNKTIAQLCLQINQQLTTLEHIKAVLPKDLANHAFHCVFNNKKLLIYTDSAIWATQLRFYGKTMLTAIGSATSAPVSVLQVKVISIPATATTSPKRRPVTPPQKVADEIRNNSLMATDPLKQALDKLSSTLGRLQSGSN
ncbi:DciA family protein [Methyloglobulus sp.]|uniref:DciA family protein n=1 Tax=Methyloglobulus sp. TaxID=2518622 RepID=UPI00398A4D8C